MVAVWEEFLGGQERRHQVSAIADLYPDVRSMYVDFADVEKFDPDLANYTLQNPTLSVRCAEDALKRMVSHALTNPFLHFRIKGLPHDSRMEIRKLRAKHLGTFVSVEGLVRKATEVRPRVTMAEFECARCLHRITVEQEGMLFHEPLECPKEEGGCGRGTGSTKFRLLTDPSKFVDTQKIEIQEPPEGLRGGSQPERLVGYIEDDLSGRISPGDRVMLNGILRSTQKGTQVKSTLFEIHLDINSIEYEEKEYEEVLITPEDEIKIVEFAEAPDFFDRVIASISPTIYGYDQEKEALALQLFGGVSKLMDDGTRIRGDIHIALIGDPGTAKSQILRYMAQLAPRGIYTSGKSSSAAGLTAAAVKDEFGEGRWTLEAGALVLADKGLACIDELDKMNDQDRSSIHESLEQGTISVAKAGITATLQSRCAVLGAANPKYGRFDDNRSVAEQIDLPPALLSRFDAIFTMTDRPNSEQDRKVAAHILRAHRRGEVKLSESPETVTEVDTAEILRDSTGLVPVMDREFLRKYVAFSKRITPIMSDEAVTTLEGYYVSIRKLGEGEEASVPITARQLEALIRLSEASARARLSNIVNKEDSERAIKIVEYYLGKVASEGGRRDIDIIATGTSRSQREQIYVLRSLVQQLSDERRGVSAEELIQKAGAENIPEDRVRALLKRLSDAGEVYSPQPGYFKLASEERIA
ncbi:MAG: minichromosome maintenance protein MCM [Candidatus Thermoplasmatota archaeon]|nr:minichromosome maintenance protein MCM [Candidatus Thermoplasmatota archaeon]